MEWIKEADTPQKQKIRTTKLRNSIEKIKQMLRDDSLISGYCRWFVSQSQEYAEAERLISTEI